MFVRKEIAISHRGIKVSEAIAITYKVYVALKNVMSRVCVCVFFSLLHAFIHNIYNKNSVVRPQINSIAIHTVISVVQSRILQQSKEHSRFLRTHILFIE